MTTTTIESIKPIEAIDFHQHPPMSLSHLRARHRWILPVATTAFLLLRVGATLNLLPWDRPITNMAVDERTAWLTGIFRKVSFLGSTKIVFLVAALAAAAAWKRCPRLAMAIVVIALARPLIEWALKELVGSRPARPATASWTAPAIRSRAAIRSRRPRAGACSRSSPRSTRTRRVIWWTFAICVLDAGRARRDQPGVARRSLDLRRRRQRPARRHRGRRPAERFFEAHPRAGRARNAAGGVTRPEAQLRVVGSHVLEANDVDLELLDRPVLEAAAELPAVGLVQSTAATPRRKRSSPTRLDRADESPRSPPAGT